jgi:hypothetical protein
MPTNNPHIHHTITQRTQAEGQDGWEFVCPICGYRARYRSQDNFGTQQFEILQVGDPQARHTSNHTPVRSVQPWHTEMTNVDESWLTDDVRRQMEDLLDDVDMGD